MTKKAGHDNCHKEDKNVFFIYFRFVNGLKRCLGRGQDNCFKYMAWAFMIDHVVFLSIKGQIVFMNLTHAQYAIIRIGKLFF
ncbi:hypothetical protein D2U88_07495 [Flagellimonas aequoris]|uniref:Uncharacterized protein n=1 Tax=Flagellimonas aequoris TaxID=2306997 RepID=A0A418N916_9FLAO|nr:hypothetical protein D2U88_07495 [Allomuricauda aequoris]